jgi:hypothetical protein
MSLFLLLITLLMVAVGTMVVACRIRDERAKSANEADRPQPLVLAAAPRRQRRLTQAIVRGRRAAFRTRRGLWLAAQVVGRHTDGRVGLRRGHGPVFYRAA